MDPRSFEDLFAGLLRGDADLQSRVGAETVKFPVRELDQIDSWARSRKIESRSEAIRLLVEKGLKT